MAPPDVSLPHFEGPLDLLLSLVRKNQVAITDIPIAEITRQYLNYLRHAEELNIDLGSEFVYLAAWLIQIKSRCLLPSDPEVAKREPDPRAELVQQLLDHDQVRQAAEFLKQKLEIAETIWSKPSDDELGQLSSERITDQTEPLNLLQVLQLARQALATARTYELVTPRETVSVEEMINWLEDRLTPARDFLKANALLAEQPDGRHRTALFLAMLEMAKSSRIRIEQQQCFGPILIREVA